MTGGQDNAQICLNGKCLVYGTDWTLGVSSTVTTTALSIASATTNNATLGSIVTSTNVAGVVYSTSTGVGLSANYSLVCRPSAALTCPPAYKGGTNSADITANGALQILNHGFTKALPLVFQKSAGTPAALGCERRTSMPYPLTPIISSWPPPARRRRRERLIFGSPRKQLRVADHTR